MLRNQSAEEESVEEYMNRMRRIIYDVPYSYMEEDEDEYMDRMRKIIYKKPCPQISPLEVIVTSVTASISALLFMLETSSVQHSNIVNIESDQPLRRLPKNPPSADPLPAHDMTVDDLKVSPIDQHGTYGSAG